MTVKKMIVLKEDALDNLVSEDNKIKEHMK
jgi:hypothetical protein